MKNSTENQEQPLRETCVMASCLHLPLETKWFEMTDPVNGKSEDYRKISPYWYARLVDRKKLRSVKKAQLSFYVSQLENQEGLISEFLESAKSVFEGCFKQFEVNVMTLGYPKWEDSQRIKKYKHVGIEVRTGKPEWGAEPNKLYFVIMHGRPIA